MGISDAIFNINVTLQKILSFYKYRTVYIFLLSFTSQVSPSWLESNTCILKILCDLCSYYCIINNTLVLFIPSSFYIVKVPLTMIKIPL